MTNKQFEQWMDAEKAKLAECLRGSGRLDEDGPDIPGISGADSLKDQYYWFELGNNTPPAEDGIDWEAIEKELKAFAGEVITEWYEKKKAQDKREAYEMGRE
ncbi:hypothetical protein IQ269_21115 [Tychonema sp. LEGE 07199]|uniref:hypothetical protein n=1 Tax=unclassified Tychonema TaxID=2642144 RepID=UPI00187EB9C1|nr:MULTISPECIES: hypothetical protein [unclassified Tychonema]MBE9123228.1 hypothetical protein [Tychonema sp. LEGE 07199]MBE9133690.1 hypothetical protein [Tychonema sp. LEGE 07196]